MAHASYILDNATGSATFTKSASGSSAINLNSISEWSYTETGTTTLSNSDGNPYVQAAYQEDINGVVTITTKNPQQLAGVIDNGDDGELVLRGVKKDQGKRVDTTDSIVYTYGKAIVTDISETVPHMGDSQATITFAIVDNGTAALYTTS